MAQAQESDVRISVLDTSPVVAGSTAREALQHTLDLAVLADDLGYHRYWTAEHHGMAGVASAAPAVVAGRLAAATHRLRVGSGGVLLPHHAPIVVAEQFGTLTAFHPGRIDLGVGRAPGGSSRAADAVRPESERTATDFPGRLEELLGYLDGTQPVRAIPADGNTPAVWLLGSTTTSAQLAAARGLPYAFARHLNPGDAAAALHRYRTEFRPGRIPAPASLVSVAVIAAETDEHAEWLAGPTRLKILQRLRGGSIRLPPPGEAAKYPWTDEERAEIAVRSRGLVVGSPATVREQLQAVLDETGTGELMITTRVFDHADRRASYELVSSVAKGLTARPG
ncbi:LLM class flavin-dependent oxidoreductase [Amycolatopsis jiangsuensis]|uniref:Luciferase family oxidoreductase group 1 n=1 Tax=Amycolatopsis jiangsuensis TaxID=1181879 RepID=A0A840INS3_9PSEU|nr:LLM class flavin-dependent oxidoreductase [Amycolatopsis jiangsuensis]MBB4682858.1 luciferase family oxidoreductase group 1 [Amycolatopsis jiangsuensis]